jgi:preprotein translocase SecE subunit
LFTRPGFSRWLVNVEERGWFHATSYKPSQGVKVRRGTVIGLLAVGLAGVYTLVRHHTFGDAPLGLYLPFTEGLAGRGRFFLPLLYGANVMGPLLLVVLLGWVSWRVVNWPTFADFLIATEAEMNKVSWTTRKRLVQDTIVVLVTVVLMTVFLFVVDIIWIQVLRNPVLPVLEVDMKAERQKQTTQTQW